MSDSNLGETRTGDQDDDEQLAAGGVAFLLVFLFGLATFLAMVVLGLNGAVRLYADAHASQLAKETVERAGYMVRAP
jgi:heme/copper-type cytochrome/quinol oxidase subunit 1